jgi:hypothetical protein
LPIAARLSNSEGIESGLDIKIPIQGNKFDRKSQSEDWLMIITDFVKQFK